MSSWELERSLTGHALAVSALAIAPDGQTLVSGSWDKTIKIWHLTTGELQETIAGQLNIQELMHVLQYFNLNKFGILEMSILLMK